MTSNTEIRTLPEKRIFWAKFFAVFIVAFFMALSLVIVQNCVWPRKKPESADNRSYANVFPDVRVPEVGSVSGCGLPVPVLTGEYYPRSSNSRSGVSFQAVYESGLAPREIVAFYAFHLEKEGWQGDRRISGMLKGAGSSGSMVFLKRNNAVSQQIIITLYPGDGVKTKCEYRFSLISRPEKPLSRTQN